MLKYFILTLGICFLGIAILGFVILPLPATPFLFLAAFCFSKSSPRLYNWILNQKYLGSSVQSYVEHRVLSLRLKILCVIGIVAFLVYFVGFVFEQLWSRSLIGGLFLGIIIIVLIHPSKPRHLSKQKTVDSQ